MGETPPYFSEEKNMPNHITTKITVDAVNADDIIESLRSKESDFNFNTVIPTPLCFEGFEPHSGIITRAKNACGVPVHENELIAALELSNRQHMVTEPCNAEDLDDVIKAIQCYKETGYFYWHDWNIQHWGTKWNAYDVTLEDNTVTFNTAWSHPTEILLALSRLYPEAEFSCVYADEDHGANCGEINYQNGSIIHENIAPHHSDMDTIERDKWLDFALDVKGYTNEEKEKYYEGFEE